MSTLRLSLGALALAFTAGCATGSLNPNRIPDAQASIKEAEAAGAAKIPEAATYLKLANEEMTEGQQLVSTGVNDRADMMFLRTQADANLAKGVADFAQLQTENTDLQTRLKAAGAN